MSSRPAGHLPPEPPASPRAEDQHPTAVTARGRQRGLGGGWGKGVLVLWDPGPLVCDPMQGQLCVRVSPDAEGRYPIFITMASLEIELGL